MSESLKRRSSGTPLRPPAAAAAGSATFQSSPLRPRTPPPRTTRPHPPRRGPLTALLYLIAVITSAYLVARHVPASRYYYWALQSDSSQHVVTTPSPSSSEIIKLGAGAGLGQGHAPFDDGRKTVAPSEYLIPASDALYWVNVMLGNGGPEPDLSGVSDRYDPSGRTSVRHDTMDSADETELYGVTLLGIEDPELASLTPTDVSMCPYNQSDTSIHGFIGTHQPAVWMGESGPAQIFAGLGPVLTDFHQRGLGFNREDEYASANYYSNVLRGPHGSLEAELTATSRVGHLRFTFHPEEQATAPFIVLDASRASVITSTSSNVTYPNGGVTVDMTRNEVYGWNDERQDHILVGEDLAAPSFRGYFVARFSEPFTDGGISRRGRVVEHVHQAEGHVLSAWVTFAPETAVVEVRVGVSFISVDQARKNLELETPDGQSLEDTSRATRTAWADKLDALQVEGASPRNLSVLYTSLAHTLVYPYEVSENAGTASQPSWHYYSGYTDAVEDGESYSGYSIWDTFRAETAWLLLIAPERIAGMMTSMLQDYQQGGWLPMWKNLVETNIMVGTHADSIIAQAMRAGVTGFDWDLAWEAVRKDAFTPPDRDTELTFFDRQEHTPQEVRAGLTEYADIGYVAADLHAESGSRTLDYAYDDWAASIVARHVGADTDADLLEQRSKAYTNLWNADTGFMEARWANGSWAGEKTGWTEGDHWAYTLNVMHDAPGLINLMGGEDAFVNFLDRHFDGGHNLHTNEPSHHIPYLYALAGAADKTQEHVLYIGQNDYNETDTGLSGNEDCGQMSAWYLFSAMGFYPVDPASATYIIGTPFFDRLVFNMPGSSPHSSPSSSSSSSRSLVIEAKGASSGKKYVRGVTVNGVEHNSVVLDHAVIARGGDIVFDMADRPQSWPRQ